MEHSLKGLHIVVTRPADQAEALCSAIEARGGHAIRWPVIQIQAIPLSESTQQCINQLPRYDRLIFISANAAHYGLAAIRHSQQTIQQQDLFAIGKATARALENAGLEEVQIPDVSSSQGLLAMAVFSSQQIADQHCLIFRGVGGSESLAQGLQENGASVDYAEVYQRLPADSPAQLLEQHWQQQQLDIIIVTSIAGLDNLFAILGAENRQRLCSTPLLTLSSRIAQYAKQQGFNNTVLITKSATDKDIIATMQTWHQLRETR